MSEIKALQTELTMMKKGPIDRLHMDNKVHRYMYAIIDSVTLQCVCSLQILEIQSQNLSKLFKVS